MNSPTSFDDDESFFGSYDAEQAVAASLAFDEAEGQPPTPEQLAHLTRFRKPVALVVSSMALLSVVALGVHSSQQRGSQRELVAHYHSAIAAPALVATLLRLRLSRKPLACPKRRPASCPKRCPLCSPKCGRCSCLKRRPPKTQLHVLPP